MRWLYLTSPGKWCPRVSSACENDPYLLKATIVPATGVHKPTSRKTPVMPAAICGAIDSRCGGSNDPDAFSPSFIKLVFIRAICYRLFMVSSRPLDYAASGSNTWCHHTRSYIPEQPPKGIELQSGNGCYAFNTNFHEMARIFAVAQHAGTRILRRFLPNRWASMDRAPGPRNARAMPCVARRMVLCG
jgi:hypothetical protein